MKQLELFAGIGGFGLAGHWAGIETVCQVEIDPFCQRVLEKNFPHAHRHDDIHTFNGRPWRGSVDIVSGGFPCQPYSHAGKRLGNDDDRALWPQMLRVIREVGPAWVIGENVAGLISMDGGRVFDGIVTDLENAGYSVEAFVIPACAVGAPHRRDRLWIVAHRDGERQQQPERLVGNERGRIADGNQECLTADAARRGWERRPHDKRQAPAERNGIAEDCGAIADAARIGNQAHVSVFWPTNPYRGNPRNGFDANGAGCEKCNAPEKPGFSGFDTGLNAAQWDEHWIHAATRTCRVDDGIPRRVDRGKRIKTLGNAIVPQVAFQIFQAIKSTSQ